MVRNSYELKLMKESGKIAASALKKALDAAKPGVTGLEIDKIAERQIYKLGGDLSYKTVPGYKFATCITVNDAVVHGLPTAGKLKEGDLVSIDLAVSYKGWHTDCAWSKIVQSNETTVENDKKKFLQIGEEALWEGVGQAVEGNRVGDISNAIGSKVESEGYHIVRTLVGHGVGRNLHEDPEIPGVGKKGTGNILKTGMTLAIEVIYTKGTPEVILGSDGWTYYSADQSWGGLFEMTVAVGKSRPEVITRIGNYGL